MDKRVGAESRPNRMRGVWGEFRRWPSLWRHQGSVRGEAGKAAGALPPPSPKACVLPLAGRGARGRFVSRQVNRA